MALTHYTGTATTPGQQILIVRYPEGTLAWIYATATPGVTDTVLDNPLTTDGGTGAYDFYGPSAVRIIELL